MSLYREIFVFVAGSTPQIVSETIYALSRQSPPVHPDKLIIITTATGRRKITESLIGQGILQRLVSEYSLPPLSFTEASFRIATGSEGGDLDDIRSAEENEAVGDLITSVIRQESADPGTRLHCSLAGGRKTMSFFLGSALQLFGRPQDRLYHVLVSPEFEANPAFFYPPVKPQTIQCRLPDGTTADLSTASARIELAELPFVRLSGRFTLKGSSFRELVDESQEGIDTAAIQPQVRVNLAERTVTIGGTLVELVPVQLAIYTSILRQKTDHCIYPDRHHCLDCTGCYRVLSQFATAQALEEMVTDYGRIYADNPMRVEDFSSRWNPKKLELPILRQNISKINRAIREQVVDNTLAEYFVIASEKVYGGSRYGVRVEKGRIAIG